MKSKYQFLFFLFTFFFGGSAWAQQNTVATGGEATGSGGSVSFSIGQIDYSSQNGSNGSLTQGVQQPLTIETTGLTEAENTFSIKLYPNPTVAELRVDLKDISLDQLNYVLTDAKGKELQVLKVDSEQITIQMLDYSRGNYFLNFVQKGKVVGSYSVIKN